MADQNPINPGPSVTPGLNRQPASTNPTQPPSAPARPISPPTGIPVQETDLSNLSPSPSPHLPPSQVNKPTPSGVPPTVRPATPTQPKQPENYSFKSSVRTMAQDIGTTTPPIAIPAPVKPPQKPTISIPPPPSPKKVSMPMPPKPGEKKPGTSIDIPPDDQRGSKSMIWLILGVLVLGVVIVLFFLLRGSSKTDLSPAPSPKNTIKSEPSPTIGLLKYFASHGDISGDIDLFLLNTSANVGEVKLYKAGAPGVTLTPDFANVTDQNSVFFTIFGKPDGSVGRGFIIKVNDATLARLALSTWEKSMPSDFSGLFKIDQSKSISNDFLSNTYNGSLIKYKNFADAYNSIDYAIVTAPDGDNYAIFTNSRDHIFVLIDKIIGILPSE